MKLCFNNGIKSVEQTTRNAAIKLFEIMSLEY